MHEQIKIMKENELNNLRNQRTALDSQITTLETELGLKNSNDNKPTPAEEFQKQRDAASSMKSPFTFGKK
jgi:hypothetical protein